MKGKLFLIMAIAAMSGVLSLKTASAYTVTQYPGDPLGYLNDTGATIFTDFNGSTGGVMGGSLRNYGTSYLDSSQPFDPTALASEQYYAVTEGGTGTLSFGTDITSGYFGLYWGSIDTYNTIQFLDGGIVQDFGVGGQDFGGSTEIGVPPFSSKTSLTSNRYISFFGLPTFDQVKFLLDPDQNAFEFDNIALMESSAVPIPAAVWLLGSGLFGMALIRRRK